MENWFNDDVAIVTGAGDGIGQATAILFAQRGARVMVTDARLDAANLTRDRIIANGGRAIVARCDVTNSREIEFAIDETVAQFGRLNCAFNNAGINIPQDNGDWDEEAFRRTIDVNLIGVMNCVRVETEHMRKNGGGAIVNSSSLSGLKASKFPQPAYTASKHGVIGLTKTAALQHAKSGIRVNSVCPGVTKTRLITDLIAQGEHFQRAIEEALPMGRMADPEEIAEVVVWLCCDKSSYVSGHSMVIDSGVMAG